MDSLLSFLAAAGTIISLCKGSYDIYGIAIKLLDKLRTSPGATVLAFLNDLGCRSDADIRQLVERWDPPTPLPPDKREELIALLLNLAHGARAQTTQGTPTSSFARCSDLLVQLTANLKPARRKGQEIGPGWRGWKLDRFLGMGSFGEVWLGRSPNVAKPKAFKFFTRPDAKEWLDRERDALNRLCERLGKHENIIDLDNVVVEEQPWPFLVLEFVGGGSLEEWILSRPDVRLAVDKRAVLEDVARGLARAHAVKIYHRDLKPANVLLTAGPGATAKIADFGLGRVGAEDGSTGNSLASFGDAVGTWLYLPPEAFGPFGRRVPARDDIFAAGRLVVSTGSRAPGAPAL